MKELTNGYRQRQALHNTPVIHIGLKNVFLVYSYLCYRESSHKKSCSCWWCWLCLLWVGKRWCWWYGTCRKTSQRTRDGPFRFCVLLSLQLGFTRSCLMICSCLRSAFITKLNHRVTLSYELSETVKCEGRISDVTARLSLKAYG